MANINLKSIFFLLALFCSSCSKKAPTSSAVSDQKLENTLTINIISLSDTEGRSELEIAIENKSNDKIEISSDGMLYEKSLLSVVMINGESKVLQNFPSQLTIQANSTQSYTGNLEMLDEELTDTIQFSIGIMRWKIGNEQWNESPQGIHLRSKTISSPLKRTTSPSER